LLFNNIRATISEYQYLKVKPNCSMIVYIQPMLNSFLHRRIPQ